MKTLPHKHAININCGQIYNINLDSGGYLSYYLRDKPETGIKFLQKKNVRHYICKECSQKQKLQMQS